MKHLRWLMALVALVVWLPGELNAQEECGPDWGSGTGTAFAYWVTADDAQRSRHTNLATALAAMADSVRSRPEAEWRVKADFLGEWRGPCAEPTDTTQLPPDTVFVTDTIIETDTVTVTDTVEVGQVGCPVGWTCYDSTWVPAPQIEEIDAVAETNPRGIRVTWRMVHATRFTVSANDFKGWSFVDTLTTDDIPACGDTIAGCGELFIDYPPSESATVVVEASAIRDWSESDGFIETNSPYNSANVTMPAAADGPPERVSPDPTFTEEGGQIRATWEPAAGADSYWLWWTGVEGRDPRRTTTETSILLDLQSGDWFCTTAQNDAGRATNTCAQVP